MTICKCGMQAATSVKFCSHCGRKLGGYSGLAAAFLFLLVLFTVVIRSLTTSVAGYVPPLPTLRTASDETKPALSLQDVIAVEALRAIKTSLKNPDSYHLRGLLYMPALKGDTVGAVCGKYNATNSFGATIQTRFVVTPKGRMFQDITENSQFVTAFNRYCANRTGEQRAEDPD
jgi:hypothetical protein